ncbi:SSI family serine proteinase inhibitor [Streptomyces sp. NPDC049687]|uniref:SSI family serine proteinase inhibitor n=1 Tax=Streptomyces sp. NPDC049687 TaxID=3365596 RepID=UPI0037BD3261
MKHFSTTPLRRALPIAAALLLATGAAPAKAASQDSLSGNWLHLTVTRGTPQSADTRGTLLLCAPPQGHRRAAQACEQLAAVNGDVRALPAAKDTICALVYAPVTARASGQWNGRPVEYAETFGNACEMGARTGAVFALDDGDAQVPGV